MTGGTAAHSAIQGNIAAALKTRLRVKPCPFHGSELKIEVAGSIRYPDGLYRLLARPASGKVEVAALCQCSACRLPWNRQDLHDFHRVAGENAEMRMFLEQLCRRVLRLCLDDYVT